MCGHRRRTERRRPLAGFSTALTIAAAFALGLFAGPILEAVLG